MGGSPFATHGGFRQDCIDVRRQIAAAHVELGEADAPVLYPVLLRGADRKIAGIETLAQCVTSQSRFQPDSLGQLPLRMNGSVPAGKRTPRDEMIAVALAYTEGLRIGSFTAVDEENGTVPLWMYFRDTNSCGPGNALVTFEAFDVQDVRRGNPRDQRVLPHPAEGHVARLAFVQLRRAAALPPPAAPPLSSIVRGRTCLTQGAVACRR